MTATYDIFPGNPSALSILKLLCCFFLGEAKSKKAAKREAARHLLYQLLERSAGQRYSTQTPSTAVEYRSLSDPAKKPVSTEVLNLMDYLNLR